MDIANAESRALARLTKLLDSTDERIALKAATEIMRHAAAIRRRADQAERAQARQSAPPPRKPAATPTPHAPVPLATAAGPNGSRPSRALALTTRAGAP